MEPDESVSVDFRFEGEDYQASVSLDSWAVRVVRWRGAPEALVLRGRWRPADGRVVDVLQADPHWSGEALALAAAATRALQAELGAA